MRAALNPVSAAGELQHPVGQLEPLQHRFGVAGQELVLRFAVVGTGEPDQLHLVELVHPDQAAGVLARRAGLAPEARA